MAKKSRPKTGGTRGAAGAKGGRPAGGPHGRFGKTGAAGLKAGVFARMRQDYDVVAFAVPATLVVVRLYVEALETFQIQKRQPRNFVLILAQGPESDPFEAYQASYDNVAPLLPKAQLVEGERAYWLFGFKHRHLTTADGTRVELKKLQKRS